MKQVNYTRALINAKPLNVTITDFNAFIRAAIAKVYPKAKL